MKLKMKTTLIISAIAVLIGALVMTGEVGALTAIFDQHTNITTTNGNITLAQIAQIQPGLGTVMMEYGNRMYTIYYAAKSGNWDLASYQLKEAREIQEVGENTRPGRAAMLKAFESAYLDQLNNTINSKDWNAFQTQYNITVDGCNACHTANGFSYIHYTLPTSPPSLP